MKALTAAERKDLATLDKKVRAGRATYREAVRAVRLAARRHAGA